VTVALVVFAWRLVTQHNERTTIAQQPMAPISAPPPMNVSADCPGVLSTLETLTTEEKLFNPKGCFFYMKGTGKVVLKGALGDERHVDLSLPMEFKPWPANFVRAEEGTATVQYILCAAPKQQLERLDCN
jgi:hypothetical protein